MSDFVKGFAEIKEDKVCLFTELYVLASSSTSMISFPGTRAAIERECFGL